MNFLDRFSGKKLTVVGSALAVFPGVASAAESVLVQCVSLGGLALVMGCYVLGQAYQDAHAKNGGAT